MGSTGIDSRRTLFTGMSGDELTSVINILKPYLANLITPWLPNFSLKLKLQV